LHWNQENLAQEIETSRNIGYWWQKNKIAVSYSPNSLEFDTPDTIQMVSYKYNKNYWVITIDSADGFGRNGSDLEIELL